MQLQNIKRGIPCVSYKTKRILYLLFKCSLFLYLNESSKVNLVSLLQILVKIIMYIVRHAEDVKHQNLVCSRTLSQ